ncbi:hypothetical protein [Lentzea sp. CC55]|nr:hypothetical protein [Lentzea sp. CC55]
MAEPRSSQRPLEAGLPQQPPGHRRHRGCRPVNGTKVFGGS